MKDSPLGRHVLETEAGELIELPVPVVTLMGRRITLFGGGYLRLAPKRVIDWGLRQLRTSGQPLVVYLHPREVDPGHPRLPLSLPRRFKCYVGLKTALEKIEWLCQRETFSTMAELAGTAGAGSRDSHKRWSTCVPDQSKISAAGEYRPARAKWRSISR